MQANDSDVLERLLEDGVVLHSPVVSLDHCTGRADTMRALRASMKILQQPVFREPIGSAGQFSCPFSGTVRGRPVDIGDVVVLAVPYDNIGAAIDQTGGRAAGKVSTERATAHAQSARYSLARRVNEL